jgi:hypothetical protein
MLTLSGELKQITNFKTNSGKEIETLHVLHWTGVGFNIERVANFTGQRFSQGEIEIDVAVKPYVAKDGKGYLNFAAYEQQEKNGNGKSKKETDVPF